MSSYLGDVSRRDFMKYSAMTAAALGLSQIDVVTKVSDAIAASKSNKPSVIWLEGQDCAGCTTSFASALYPPVASLVLDTLSVRYHETIMAAAGHTSEEALHATVKKGGYVLIVEGSIPTVDDRFCMVGGRPFKEILLECAANAGAIIAVGACATFGGIPAAGPTGAVGVSKLVKKPVINLSTCPVHVDHLVGTVVYFLTTGKVPPLDEVNRPLMYFGESIHDTCRRRGYFESENFLTDWNDPAQKNWCLLEKGCKGPDTFSDCAVRRWNNGLSFCLDSGAGCRGCAEPSFYSGMSPLYGDDTSRTKEIKLGSRKSKTNSTRKEV